MKLSTLSIYGALALLWLGLASGTAHAHFLWLVKTAKPQAAVQIYFGEQAGPDDAELLKLVKQARLWQLTEQGSLKKLKVVHDDEALFAALPKNIDPESLFLAQHEYGVLDRGDAPFLLQYYAKTGPALGSDRWNTPIKAKQFPLDVAPQRQGENVLLTVRWQQKPVSDSEVTVIGGKLDDFTAETNDQGQVTFPAEQAGLYSIRARHVENKAGKHEGKAYQSVKHYSTLALKIGKQAANSASQQRAYPEIPQLVTSFGAAITDDSIYMYGGHTAGAHSYWNKSQAHTLYRLPLEAGAKWEAVAEGPRLQGLAMVAHAGKVYRLGGFTAQNEEGEEHDLHSQAAAQYFEPEGQQWKSMPQLPEPRSSFDAAMLDGSIYMVGGWALDGEKESHWHETAYALDLEADKLQWKPIAQPPFERRALAVAAFDKQLYVIGGMQAKGGPTTKSAIYRPKTDTWSEGPSLPGEPMEGFGCSAFATGGRLYVSTISGKLLRLGEDRQSWEQVAQLERERFFHRMLPLSDSQLLMLGGASMSVGKFGEVDVVEVE